MIIVTFHFHFFVDVNMNSREHDRSVMMMMMKTMVINDLEMEVAPCVLHVFIGTPRNNNVNYDTNIG